MKKILFAAALSVFMTITCAEINKTDDNSGNFVKVSGVDLVKPDGSKLFIKGTNLGNWLNPEGYMFGFDKSTSQIFINQVFCEMVGPDFTAQWWQQFRDNYITRDDIRFIAECGANTIRLPFNYKLFTDEDFMGMTNPLAQGEGFRLMDEVVAWCKEFGLYLILDMHDCPGGQTGDNIDDSYGYPWLFESKASQSAFCEIWKLIADHYKNEPAILGYELMNEPIATYFDKDYFNPRLEPLYKKATAAIREVDKNHIIILGGAQWNSEFNCFSDWNFDDQLMYTCHRYGGPATADAIQSYIDFRDKSGRPMYMGELGHNTSEWHSDFCHAMQENNIGWLFWPYKKVDDSCMVGIKRPGLWSTVVRFEEANRATYAEIRDNRPNQETMRNTMNQFIEQSKFINCIKQTDYIESICLK